MHLSSLRPLVCDPLSYLHPTCSSVSKAARGACACSQHHTGGTQLHVQPTRTPKAQPWAPSLPTPSTKVLSSYPLASVNRGHRAAFTSLEALTREREG